MSLVPITVPERPAWKVQLSVIWALYIRETKKRFGMYQLGLLWAIIESLSTVVIKGFLYGLFLQRTIPSMPYAVFLMAGYLPFHLFKSIIRDGLSSISSNQNLLVYKQLKPIDPLIARLLLEVLIFFLSIILFLGISAWVGYPAEFAQPLEILFVLLSLLMIATGIGLFCGMKAYTYRDLKKIVPVAMTPLLFISCVLHPLSSVPDQYQGYFLWNPLVVIFETVRKGLYSDYPSVELPIMYPFCVGIVSMAFGMGYYWRHRNQHYMGSRND